MDAQAQAALVNGIVALLGTVLTLLASFLIQYVRARYKWVNETMMQEAAKTGIALAEEFAATKIKDGLAHLSSADKLNVATTAVIAKFPNVSQAEAETIVRGELPKVGLGAASVLQALAAAARTPEGR